MRIEKLNENKIRIFFDIDDLIEKNIDLHTFMSNSMETQDLFLDMLDKAESELGFKTKNYKLIIEALASSSGTFIITVTRILPNEGITPKKKRTVKTKIKSVKPSKISSISVFNTFDDFCSFCSYMNNSYSFPKNKLKPASLISYNNKYYLIFNNLTLDLKDFKSLNSCLAEFSFSLKNGVIYERKIREYGKIVFKKDAINECIKYFC